jgi:hypothetical protein
MNMLMSGFKPDSRYYLKMLDFIFLLVPIVDGLVKSMHIYLLLSLLMIVFVCRISDRPKNASTTTRLRISSFFNSPSVSRSHSWTKYRVEGTRSFKFENKPNISFYFICVDSCIFENTINIEFLMR